MVEINPQSPQIHRLEKDACIPIELELFEAGYQRHLLRQQIFGSDREPAFRPTTTRDSYTTFHSFSNGFTYQQKHSLKTQQPPPLDWNTLPEEFRNTFQTAEQIAFAEVQKSRTTTVEPTLNLDELDPDLQAVTENSSYSEGSEGEVEHFQEETQPINTPDPIAPSKKFLKKQLRIAQKKETRKTARQQSKPEIIQHSCGAGEGGLPAKTEPTRVMTLDTPTLASVDTDTQASTPAQHKPLVVGRTKPQTKSTPDMDAPTTSEKKAAFNHAIEENVKTNTASAAPVEDATNLSMKKKEKAPKQPKAPKAAPSAAPLTPALIDLRVGHILRAVAHPNADSLFVSTIVMGDPEGTDHTQVDEETGKIVRTVCSGLNGLVPLEEMQDRKVVVVANLKPVNMRSIKSAAMVLAASPPAEEGADPHAADRIVELVSPPEGAKAGDKVYFEGWPYGDGRGPEKQLNPKKKQWEAIQPGFYTNDDCVVGFDSSKSEMDGVEKGDLVVEGKGSCTVKSLKGAIVR